ncbi:MAG: ATP-binding cassette domain-containing protein [Acidobacteria bacterium]|nr:ATP-binding cassette domain-containing protein [Acidobacteriota bacterium]
MDPDQVDREVLIDVRGLTKTYGPIRALDSISFQAKRGDILGFLGPNGAGKSTAMKIITCFLEADSGDVEVGGKNIREHSIEVRRMIGYCPESAPAYGEMTVDGFLRFICDARDIEDATAAIDRVVEMTGLERVIHQTIETLSKGYKRRVGLAQALIHDPEVLILDEPTDGLDPNQKALIHELISNLSKNKCIVLSTHILDEVERICNRALVISEGKILVDATPESLMEQAPNHNVIRVSLASANDAMIDEIGKQSWCRRVERESEQTFEVVPVDGRNHLSDLLSILKDAELLSIHLQEGRLDELFRAITKGVAA